VQQLQYLCSTELYETLEVTLDKSWLPLVDTQLSEELLQAALTSEESSLAGAGGATVDQLDAAVVGDIVEKKVCSVDEEEVLCRNWVEVGEFAVDGTREQRNVSPTMLDQLNSAEEFLNQALIVAPREGMTPISLFMDKHCEEASFPNIYCGTLRQFEKGISFCDCARWELTNIDQRVAHCIDNIFFKMIQIRVNFIMSMSSVRLQKGKRQGNLFTAKELKNKAAGEDLLKCDIEFKDSKALRNSPHYTEQGKKDIYVFFRQLGTATFFITNSMADTRWRELLVILSLLVDKKVILEADVDLMDTATHERLVSSDPVTCARYFRHSMDSLLTSICSCDEIIGEMEDFFLRDEFQQQRSPHSHWLAFIKDAPVYGRAPDQEICDFVDNYIRCHRDPEMDPELIKLQKHMHSGSCYRRESGCLPHCRFCYPLPPMQTTKTLTPLPDEMPKEESKALRKKWNSIFARRKEIDSAKELLDIELVNFLTDKRLTEEEYLFVTLDEIRCSSARRVRKPRLAFQQT
jgi:hypothetical protein